MLHALSPVEGSEAEASGFLMTTPWQTLLQHVDLLDAAAACEDLSDPATVMRLRKRADAALVRCAIDLTRARRKAVDKFEHADQMLADPVGVEQATSLDVARHKARRFAEAGLDTVADLCCGIGGDALALREVADTLCIDRDPARAHMAHHNTACPAAAADVTTLNLRDTPYHLDPDRRPGGRRAWRYEDCQPGADFIESLAGDGAIKLSPGVDTSQLPAGEIEMINRRGTLVQAVLWRGRLAQHDRTATLITDDQTHQLHGAPRPFRVAKPQRYLHAIDPAIERAELIGVLCDKLNLAAIHPQLGLLTSDEPTPSPWLTLFELLDVLPWRLAKVQAALREHDAGIVEVKTRGKAVDPDAVAGKLRGDGNQILTVFVLRMHRKRLACITRRL